MEYVLRHTVHMFESLFASKQVQLELHVETAGPLHADRGRILEVLSNLLGNALKFTLPRSATTYA